MRPTRVRLFGALALFTLWTPSAGPDGAAVARPYKVCGSNSYVNVDGKCVQRPRRAKRPPAGATAKCRDGTYSFSLHHRGTCSHHGGVASWL